MKLYVVLAGLLGYFEPEAAQNTALEALLLAGDPAPHVMSGEVKRHAPLIMLTPDKYPKIDTDDDAVADTILQATWLIDGENVSITEGSSDNDSRLVPDGTNNWVPLLMADIAESPVVRADCKGAMALTTCIKVGETCCEPGSHFMSVRGPSGGGRP